LRLTNGNYRLKNWLFFGQAPRDINFDERADKATLHPPSGANASW